MEERGGGVAAQDEAGERVPLEVDLGVLLVYGAPVVVGGFVGCAATEDGFSSDPLFKQLLFSHNGLDSSHEHTIILQNQYNTQTQSYFDVDYITITSGDGNNQ